VARGSGRFAKVKLVLDIFVLAGGSRLQGSDVAVFKGGRYVLGSPSRSYAVKNSQLANRAKAGLVSAP